MEWNLNQMSTEELAKLERQIARATVALNFNLIGFHKETLAQYTKLLKDIQDELNNRGSGGMSIRYRHHHAQLQG